MSSDRHDLLAKILETKYDLEICEEHAKARLLANLNTLLDQSIGQRNLSRYELLEALKERMATYRKERRRRERPWGTVLVHDLVLPYYLNVEQKEKRPAEKTQPLFPTSQTSPNLQQPNPQSDGTLTVRRRCHVCGTNGIG